VAIITPFNFPLEIPALQTLSAIFMGNRPMLKVDEKVAIVMEQFIRLLIDVSTQWRPPPPLASSMVAVLSSMPVCLPPARPWVHTTSLPRCACVYVLLPVRLRSSDSNATRHHLLQCGMPKKDVDLLYSDGRVANELLMRSKPRMLLFTGSQHVADKLCQDMNGRIKVEDAGFDWKILGPDVQELEYVTWQSDQDAYAFSGQKCSAQSMVFMHTNWEKAGFVPAIKKLALERSLAKKTISPTLSVTNGAITAHIDRLLELPGAKVLFGGNPISEAHTIPSQFGSFEPTAVFVPLKEMLASEENFDLVTTEIFGPFQIVTEYTGDQLDLVLESIERMHAHLTAAIVSDDQHFVSSVLAQSVNGTTYVGTRGRTTGAPANHWFGPAGDPRAGGIHTTEAIQATWSGHREIILDNVVPHDWQKPTQT
jgi:1-pyrroline-5-carboxylate dehydrogenase